MNMKQKLDPGMPAPLLHLPTLGADAARRTALAGSWTLVSFHRYASCPICNVTLQRFRQRYNELEALGLHKIAVFHSPMEKLAEYVEPDEFPFSIAADPDMHTYAAWGVSGGIGGMLDPRSAVSFLKTIGKARLSSPSKADGSMTTRPADFIVDPSGIVRLVHYGSHIGDSLPVDDVLNAFVAVRGDVQGA